MSAGAREDFRGRRHLGRALEDREALESEVGEQGQRGDEEEPQAGREEQVAEGGRMQGDRVGAAGLEVGRGPRIWALSSLGGHRWSAEMPSWDPRSMSSLHWSGVEGRELGSACQSGVSRGTERTGHV